MYYKPGQTVRVNKDITRVKEWVWNETGKNGYPDHDPVMEQYAKEGETGVILEVFVANDYCAKVKINDQIKTLRLTSLDHI